MNIPDDGSENLRFLIAELTLQINHLHFYLHKPSVEVAKHIIERDGYTHNLCIRIQNSCRNSLSSKKNTSLSKRYFNALELIASELEKIAELCRSCVNSFTATLISTHSHKQVKVLNFKAYQRMLEQLNKQVSQIEIAFYESNTEIALKIGEIAPRFQKINSRLQNKFIKNLKHKKYAQDMMLSYGVMSNLMQMANVMKNMSEIIISASIGQSINTDRYHSLRHSIEQRWNVPMEQVEIETIAETRSGSGISGISSTDKTKGLDNKYDAIFKDGQKNKVKEEKERVESWHKIFPGLAPKIIDYNKKGNSASILIEHLPGLTYEHILLNESDILLTKTQKYLQKTLKKIWKRTYNAEKISATYIGQLQKRLENVYSLHPEFKQLNHAICGHQILAMNELIKQADIFEKKNAQAPFSVYIHGDFNVDNIIFDPLENKINFIDLHRSQYMDYVQDVSVFMVSHYRLQVMSPQLRQRILQTSCDFYDFASEFAKKSNDENFNIRLTLALARSFMTSTRFILDRTLSENMYIRARYLLENILSVPENKLDQYQLPINKVFSG